jgi:hypothetical protein
MWVDRKHAKPYPKKEMAEKRIKKSFKRTSEEAS